MATVSATMTWAASGQDLKDYLGICDTDSDESLKRDLDAATATADSYMGNPFTDAAGVDVPLPPRVEQGVFAWVNAIRQAGGVDAVTTPNVTSVKTGDLSQGFAGSKVTRTSPADLAMDDARPYWFPTRLRIWR